MGKAYLMLANGVIFEGTSVGREGTSLGEIVFTTAMTGYQETLTDPSYYGQIVTQTFPLIGNYGVNEEDYESEGSVVSGYIVREWCAHPSNFRSVGNVNDFLKKHNIVGICGIDTRRLTRILRESGVMNGVITTEDVYARKDELLEQVRAYKITGAIAAVSSTKRETYPVDGAAYHVVMYDFGAKANIVRELQSRNCSVTLVPADTSADEALALRPDGIMLTNGPGDPADNPEVIQNLRDLLPYRIPTFGICMGHQLLALANGAKTEKLKYGHRGANQPVVDLEQNRTFVTSQNHGYAVVGESLPPDVGVVSYSNANDHTCEGVKYTNAPAFTVQFHPEAKGGPLDTAYLFDRFVQLMDEYKKKQ